jgi:Protein of unknown function (DUF3568)
MPKLTGAEVLAKGATVARAVQLGGRAAGRAVVLAAGLGLLVGGCGGGGGGGGGSAPAQGDKAPAAKADGFQTSMFGYVAKTYDGELGQCVDAAKAALKKLGLEVTDEGGGIFEKSLDAEARDGTSLVVRVKELSRGTTKVSIKVGYLLGDGDAARRIHSELEGELAARRDEAAERQRRWRAGSTTPGMGAATSTTVPPAAPR